MRPYTQYASCLAVLSLCAFLCIAAGRAQKEAEPAGTPQAIQVRVEMVSLPVVVTDQTGNHVRNLKKEDFRVFEDGVLQEIAGFAAVEEPISVALTLDTSGSTEFQLDRIRQEAMRFVRLLREEDSIAIVSFADEVKLLEPFNIYHKKNPDALRKLKPGGLSAVYEAVWLSIEQVLNLEYGRKALVFFSDGVDNRSETVTEEETLDLARKTESTIYCIYFNTDKDRFKRMPSIIDPGLKSSGTPFAAQWPPIKIPTGRGKNPEYTAGREYLAKLAQYSGGLLVDASRIENLGAAFGRIAQELRSQYSLGYYPKDTKHDGRFRKVEVKVNRPGITARTKQGYYFMR
jgi:Ca-activated chloride channel family protein